MKTSLCRQKPWNTRPSWSSITTSRPSLLGPSPPSSNWLHLENRGNLYHENLHAAYGNSYRGGVWWLADLSDYSNLILPWSQPLPSGLSLSRWMLHYFKRHVSWETPSHTQFFLVALYPGHQFYGYCLLGHSGPYHPSRSNSIIKSDTAIKWLPFLLSSPRSQLWLESAKFHRPFPHPSWNIYVQDRDMITIGVGATVFAGDCPPFRPLTFHIFLILFWFNPYDPGQGLSLPPYGASDLGFLSLLCRVSEPFSSSPCSLHRCDGLISSTNSLGPCDALHWIR